MARARAAILERGGAARSNVFTRIALALFGQMPWRGVPYIPVEIMLLPKWFSVSSRQGVVLVAHRHGAAVHLVHAQAASPRTRGACTSASCSRRRRRASAIISATPATGRLARRGCCWSSIGSAGCIDPLHPAPRCASAPRGARSSWMLERLNGEDGLGAIFPAMVNALEVMVILGYPADDPRRVTAKRALQKLLVVGPLERLLPALRVARVGHGAGQSRHAGGRRARRARPRPTRALDWLQTEQLLDEPGDWRVDRPELARRRLGVPVRQQLLPRSRRHGGGRLGHASSARTPADYAESVAPRARLAGGHAERNGGFAAFDADNTSLLPQRDPVRRSRRAARSADQRRDGAGGDGAGARRAPAGQAARSSARIAYLRAEQEPDGSWFGRWGTNYIYGTWSVLTAFAQAGVSAGRSGGARAR